MRKTVIDKATTDKPAHLPLDPEQRAVLIIHHDPTQVTIRTRGWTLNEVLAIMDWNEFDVWATFKKPWKKDRGVLLLTPSTITQERLDKLNQKGGIE